MGNRISTTKRDEIGPDTPLRLDVAAALAFPDGSITAASLRREHALGHLDIYRIAGKPFTTLADIAKMQALCRVPSSPRVSTSEEPGQTEAPSGSSSTKATNTALARVRAISQRLKRRLPTTSGLEPSPHSAKVIPIKS
jgi:hypothetical protein